MKNQVTETVGERLNPKQHGWYRNRLGRATGLLVRRLLTEQIAEAPLEQKTVGGK